MHKAFRSDRLPIALAAIGIAVTTQAAHATDAAPVYPACGDAAYHQMNYWIGDWDTYDSDDPHGPSIARTRIDPIAQGCAIHELYEQSDGLIGDSILSYDPARKHWQQTWVTNRGSVMVTAGHFADGVLVLEGEAHLGDGRTVLQRITWKSEGNDVRESALLSKDGGTTWTPAFDVLFRKHVDQAQMAEWKRRPAASLPEASGGTPLTHLSGSLRRGAASTPAAATDKDMR